MSQENSEEKETIPDDVSPPKLRPDGRFCISKFALPTKRSISLKFLKLLFDKKMF